MAGKGLGAALAVSWGHPSLWGVRGTGCREAVATEQAAGNWPVVGSVLAWGGKPELLV